MRNGAAIRAIIFDMDGVLLHSSAIHDRAFREALAELPAAAFDYTSVAGMRTDEALRAIFANNGVPFDEERVRLLAATKTRIAREAIARENPVDPDCRTVLDGLAREYRLALASSASVATVSLFLDRNSLRDRFECVLTGSDVRRAKPAPDIYRQACARLGLPAAECLVVEDAVSGVSAGKSAGATVWAIPSTSPAEDLERAGADRVLGGLGELLVLLEKPCPAL